MTDNNALDTSLILAEDPGSKNKTRKQTKDKPTDDELANQWLFNHPNTAYGLGEFRRYEDGVWNVLPSEFAEAEILTVVISRKNTGIRPTRNLFASVQELARIKVALPSDAWDSDPNLLPCRNGVLHIPTSTLYPHKPEYHFTTKLPYDFDPTATCPFYQQVLETTIPNAMSFFQEFAGYALTTDTRYEIAVWLYGPAGSGKSTVLAGLQALLGSRAGLLGLADLERSRFALTNLPGKTLVVATENPASYIQSTPYLNAIISGEPIEVDRKFKQPVLVIPTAKVAWAMNDLPRVGSAGNGLFRRVKVIEFPPLPEGKRDPFLKDRIRIEGAGILNWSLDGLKRLTDRGRFEIPPVVEAATIHFQAINDVPALFAAECCLIGPEYKVQSSLLYNAYQGWAYANGHRPQSITSIAEEWRRLGFESYRKMGITFWRGIGLNN